MFKAEMVRAILDGKKTQTRRMVKPQPFMCPTWGLTWEPKGHGSNKPSYVEKNVNWNPITLAFHNFYQSKGGSPYGGTGDRLLVKETHYRWGKWVKDGLTKKGRQRFRFKAITRTEDRGIRYCVGETLPFTESDLRMKIGWHKRPSIFMPKSACRIRLEITGVRVQRLNDITEADAKAEGVTISRFDTDLDPVEVAGRMFGPNFIAYYELWERINGIGSWVENPWVWVVEFKRV